MNTAMFLLGLLSGAIIIWLGLRYLIYRDEIMFYKKYHDMTLVDPVKLEQLREAVKSLNNDDLWKAYTALLRKGKGA